MIQVMAETEGLEGIKLSKFLKRATGSRRMSSALLKIGLATAAASGAYYANKRYNLTGRLKKAVMPAKKPVPKAQVNQSLLDRILNIFTPATQIAPDNQQTKPQTAAAVPVRKETKSIDPLLLAAIGIGIGGFLLLRKKR